MSRDPFKPWTFNKPRQPSLFSTLRERAAERPVRRFAPPPNPNPRARVATPPDVATRINERAPMRPATLADFAERAKAAPFNGCHCMVIESRAKTPHKARIVSVRQKKVNMVRELYAATFDVPREKVPPLYNQCGNKLCVQPYHYGREVPKGRRGGKRKLTREQAVEARYLADTGLSWAAIGRWFGVDRTTVRNSVRHFIGG